MFRHDGSMWMAVLKRTGASHLLVVISSGLIALAGARLAVAQPAMEVSVDDTAIEHNGLVDLGDVPVGQTVTVSYTIRNVGDAQLNLSPLTFVGFAAEDYTTDLAVASLAPGTTVGSIVSFTPSEAGPRDSVIVIINNSNQNPFAVLFTADGTSADEGQNNAIPPATPCAPGANGGVLLAALGLTGLRAFNRKRL